MSFSWPSGLYFDDGGVVLGSYPAAPGFVPSVVYWLQQLGFTQINVWRVALATMPLQRIGGDFLNTALTRVRNGPQAKKTPDLILVAGGTNNSGAGESAAVPGLLDQFGAVQERLPDCSVIVYEPIVDPAHPTANRPEAHLTRAHIRDWVDLAPGRRFAVNGEGRTDSGDGLHLTIESFNDMGMESILEGFYNFA